MRVNVVVAVSLLSAACVSTVGLAARATDSYAVAHGWPALPDDFAFGQVTGVAVDSRNRVFVLHRANVPWNDELNVGDPIQLPTVMVFDGTTGKGLTSWGAKVFRNPHGFSIDAQDNLWVTDCGRQQVLKFSNDGKLLLTLGEEQKAGGDGKHFNQPTDVAVAPDGSIYVSDGYINSRIVKFSPKGEFLLEWGKKGTQAGEFDVPHGIAVDREGLVYVADRLNMRIQVFGSDGKFVRQWRSKEMGRPWAIRIGPDGAVYVLDGGDLVGGAFNPQPPDRGYVIKMDGQGKVLTKWSRYGNYDGQLMWAHAVAIGKDGAVYVGDIQGRRAQKFVAR